MPKPQKGQFVPYETLSPGWDAVYTGETSPAPISEPGRPISRATDEQGNVLQRWSVWTWLPEEDKWDAEVKLINAMQAGLGPLDDEIRKVRCHIGSLVPCDSGFPITADEVLTAIGREELETPAFHNGCWSCGLWAGGTRSSQPRQIQSMAVIERVLSRYLAGESAEALTADLPHAAGFIRRSYAWLGPVADLSRLQKLLVEFILLPLEFLAEYSLTSPRGWRDEGWQLHKAVHGNIHGPQGRGAEIFREISAIAGVPTLKQELLDSIPDPETRDLCKLWWHRMSDEFYGGLCDCHHNTFRFIESWIHSIGTAKGKIPTRKEGTERQRLGRLLFGYVLGLDKWLLGVPMQFLLLDLGHVDLGFDPRNEILRVYAHLGEERTPVKEWLAACLWYTLMYHQMPVTAAGLRRHPELVKRGREAGVSVREWMDSRLSEGGVAQ